MTKHQHTVPECYLKNFSADRLKIFGKHKIPDTDPKVPRNYELKKGKYIESQTVVLNHYTLNNSPNPMEIETNIYANIIENDYPEVYKILTDNNRTSIDLLERTKIFITLLSLHCRTPKQFETLFELAKQHTTEEDLIKVREDYKAAHISKTLYSFLAAHQFKTVVVVSLNDTSEFLTSDNPVLIIDKESNLKNRDFSSQFNSANQIIVTINPKTCVVFAHSPDPRTFFKIVRQTKDIEYSQTLNQRQIDSADKIIYGTEKYLNAFFQLYRLV